MRSCSTLLLLASAFALAACTAPTNVESGTRASHVETSNCEGDPAFCECVNSAEIAGVSTQDAQQACSP